jgi:ABC-type phosphate transport system permease subunit
MGFAIVSIVCGLAGLFVFGYILGLLAIIFGGIALGRIRRNPELPGRGLAVAGMVLAILMLALGASMI